MASRRRGIDPIGQAAGLSAGTPVAAASADNGAEGALTGVAHTKSAVGKDLHLRRTVPADGGNVPAGQLTGQHHTGKAQLCRPACAPQRVQAHLGAGVEGQLRRRLTGQLPHPQSWISTASAPSREALCSSSAAPGSSRSVSRVFRVR